jgi:hypothetical protein
MAKLETLESGLTKQLSELADQIRALEASLLSAKEGYLKVSGALEAIAFLKQPPSEQENIPEEEAVNVALGE